MNTQKTDPHTVSGTDRGKEDNETMDFFAGKLDEATTCPSDTDTRLEGEVPGIATADKTHE